MIEVDGRRHIGSIFESDKFKKFITRHHTVKRFGG